ncbi:MAG: ABC transporter permease [Bacteroidales bacterium]|nr:ABC transporter permease [Bacteroidales bacterium]MBR5703504.1 ABC transporter permease [Bacteroidales bacterium]
MKSYLKFLSRNKLYTAIQALGLIVSLAFVIIIFCYAWQQLAITREAPDYKRIYALTQGRQDYTGAYPGEMSVVQDRVPDVEAAGRLKRYGTAVTFNGQQAPGNPMVNEVDPEIFEFLPQTFLAGDENVLHDRNQVILGETFARRVSPDMDPVGKTIVIMRDTCIVGGILRVPERSLLQEGDIYRAFKEPDAPSSSQFVVPVDLVLVRLREGADHKAARTLIDTVITREFSQMYQNYKPERSVTIPFKDLYFTKIGNATKHGNSTLVYVLIAVGILLLISALFNYINLSIALAGKRAKEMAIRSTLGEPKSRIRWRYIGESILFMAFCLVLALLLAKTLEPLFNRYIAGDVGLEVAITPAYLGVYALFVILIGLVSGLFPAWITSRYNPVEVIKGEQRRQTKTVLSKVFIIVQNVITVALISMVLVMELQYHHLMNMPLGVDMDGLYYISSGPVGKDVLAEKPYVDKMGTSNGYPGNEQMTLTSTIDEQKVQFAILSCDEDAFELFGFDVIKNYGTPMIQSLWLTESAASILSLDEDNPSIPSQLSWFYKDSHIGGIIKDFAVKGPTELAGNEVGVVSVSNLEGNSSVVLKLNRLDSEVRAELREIARQESIRITGDEEFIDMYGYIPELIEKSMESTRNFISVIEIFMILAALISLLGLVAISAYYAGMQTKNIAIRKVFGSNVATETRRSVQEYMVLVGIAVAIGIPVAVFLAERYLRQFWYRIESYGWVFVVAAIIALAISFLAVLWQTLKAAKTDPAIELKKE